MKHFSTRIKCSVIMTVLFWCTHSAAQVVSKRFVMANPVGVFLLDSDGGNQQYIYNGSSASASWTPDGRVIFSTVPDSSLPLSSTNPMNVIKVINENGSGGQVLFNGAIHGLESVIKAQMAQNGIVSFTASPPGGNSNKALYNVWLIEANGSNPHPVINGYLPSISLNGTFITYTKQTSVPGANPPYDRQVWRANIAWPNVTNETQLTFNTDPNYPNANASAISPDGSKVAIFSGKQENDACTNCGPETFGNRNVAVIPASGGTRQQVTSCEPLGGPTGQNCNVGDNPFWSPNGLKIGYDRASMSNPGETWLIDYNSAGPGTNPVGFYSQLRGAGNVPWHPNR